MRKNLLIIDFHMMSGSWLMANALASHGKKHLERQVQQGVWRSYLQALNQ